MMRYDLQYIREKRRPKRLLNSTDVRKLHIDMKAFAISYTLVSQMLQKKLISGSHCLIPTLTTGFQCHIVNVPSTLHCE